MNPVDMMIPPQPVNTLPAGDGAIPHVAFNTLPASAGGPPAAAVNISCLLAQVTMDSGDDAQRMDQGFGTTEVNGDLMKEPKTILR